MSKIFAIYIPIFAIIITTLLIKLMNGNVLKEMDRKRKRWFIIFGSITLVLGILVFIYFLMIDYQ